MNFIIVDDANPLLNFDKDSWTPVQRDHAFNGTVHSPSRPGQVSRIEFSFIGSSLEVHLSFPASTSGTFAVEFSIDDKPTQINGSFTPTSTPPTFVFIPHGLASAQHDLVVSTSSGDLGIDYLLYLPAERRSPRVAVIVGGVVTVVVFFCTITFLLILYLKRKRNKTREAPDVLTQGYPSRPRLRDRLVGYLRRCIEHHPIQPKVEQYVPQVYVPPERSHRVDRSVSSQPISVDPPSSPPLTQPELAMRQSRRVFMVMNPSD